MHHLGWLLDLPPDTWWWLTALAIPSAFCLLPVGHAQKGVRP
jgi:hypothetical protein